MKNSAPRAYANTPSHTFLKNYWHGFWGAIYTDGNVTDTSPKTSCTVSPTSCTPAALAVDHYAITHAGSGWTCHPNQITISARDFNNAAIAPLNTTTITVHTSTGKGNWALVSGGGSFNNGTPNDGIATYTFNGSETQVTLSLTHTDVANVDITVTDNFGRTESQGSDPYLWIGKCATLLGYYKMEDGAWHRTLYDVKDASGNNKHGFATNSAPGSASLPSPTVAPGAAKPGNPGTCGYGEFFGPPGSGSKVVIPSLPVDLTPGAKTSVSFWMYWDGTSNVMPVGWHLHDLYLVSGYFGFNTANADVYGIDFPASTYANQWVHVVAVFTNNNVHANKLYINGVPQTLSQKLGFPIHTQGVVSPALHLGG